MREMRIQPQTFCPLGLLLTSLKLSLASPINHAASSNALAPLYVPPAAAHDLVNSSYIVMLRDDILPSVFNAHMSFLELMKETSGACASDVSLEHVYDSDIAKGYAGKLTPEILEMVRSRPEVKYVEQEQVVYADNVQKDPPWGLARINHRNKVSSKLMHYVYPSNSGAGVLVYVIDTGVYIQHREFEGRAKWGISLVPGEGDIDGDGHGTHVAGTIASRKFGVAKKAEIVAVKVLDSKGTGSTSQIIKGVEWALTDSRRRHRYKGFVVNMSLGGSRSHAEEDAVNSAVKAGLHVVIAAGNQNIDACQHSPGSAALPITVGSSTRDDNKRPSSNFGKCVDVFAPGSDILSCGIKGPTSTALMSGTSMASPHVAGIVAHFLSIYPHKTFNPRLTSFESLYMSALANARQSLPSFAVGLLPSLESLPDATAQASDLPPLKMKTALLDLAVKGKLVGGLPAGTPNLMAYNNYIHGNPGLWAEELSEVSR